MATIDGEFIRAANDRLQWDGIWERFDERLRRDGGVHEAFDRAIGALFTKTSKRAQLILCSWQTARELLLEAREREPQGHFDTSADYKREMDKRAFQWDHDGSREHLFERGYLGTYGGAIIIASVYLGVWETDYAVVASVPEPGKVEYDGSNCVLVDMSCEE
jgi:hypothetical protein